MNNLIQSFLPSSDPKTKPNFSWGLRWLYFQTIQKLQVEYFLQLQVLLLFTFNCISERISKRLSKRMCLMPLTNSTLFKKKKQQTSVDFSPCSCPPATRVSEVYYVCIWIQVRGVSRSICHLNFWEIDSADRTVAGCPIQDVKREISKHLLGWHNHLLANLLLLNFV